MSDDLKDSPVSEYESFNAEDGLAQCEGDLDGDTEESGELEEGGPGKRHAENPPGLEGGRRRCSSAPGLCRGCVRLTLGILCPTGLLRKLSVPRPTLQSLCGVPTSQTSFIAL